MVEMNINNFFALIILFQIKHYLCDFAFQNKYMLGKFKRIDWEIPLLAHCFAHGLGTYIVLCLFNPLLAIVCSVIDIVTHFIIDRAKVVITRNGNYHPDSHPEYWYVLGLDQMSHHFVHYFFIWLYFI